MDIRLIIEMLRRARQTEFRHFCEQVELDPSKFLDARKEFNACTEEAVRFLEELGYKA